jgi:hypothetical protein
MKPPRPGLIVAALCCAGLLVAMTSAAVPVSYTQGALGATDALMLVIDGVDEELAAQGLSRMKMERDISSRLLAAGVQVVPESGLAAGANTGVLTLRIRLERAPYYFFMYNIKLTLNSKLPMNPDGSAFTTVPTWSDGWGGSIQPTDVGQIQGYAEELVTRFLAQRAGERGD